MKSSILKILFVFLSMGSFAQGSFDYVATASGTNTYTATITVPTFPSSYTGVEMRITFTNGNTGASTINITRVPGGAVGAADIRKWDGDSFEALVSGDIPAGGQITLRYSGSYFIMDSFGKGGGAALTDGSGTTANGSAVDLGGTTSGNTTFAGAFNWTWGSSGARMGNYRVWSDGTIGLDASTSTLLQVGSNTISLDGTQGQISMGGSRFRAKVDSLMFHTNNQYRLKIDTDGSMDMAGTDPGSSGDVLTSNGSGSAPTWQPSSADASAVSYTPAGDISASTVEGAINELDAEKLKVSANLSDVPSAPTALQNIAAQASELEIEVVSGDKSLATTDFASGNGGQVKILHLTGVSPQTITVPTDAAQAMPIGSIIYIRMTGTAGYLLSAAAPPTVNGTSGGLAGPGTGKLAALVKTAANTWWFDNGDALGSAYQIFRMNSAGTSAAFGSVDLSQSGAVGSSILPIANGGTGSATAPWWPLTGTGTLTGNVNMSGAFSVGIGASPSAKFHVTGLGTTTGGLALFEDNSGALRFKIFDNGSSNSVSSVSGANATAHDYNATVTATANSQSQTGWDYDLSVSDGGFTGLTRHLAQWRLSGNATPLFDIQTTSLTTNTTISLLDLRLAGTFVARNPLGPLSIRGGSGTGDFVTIAPVSSTQTSGLTGVHLWTNTPINITPSPLTLTHNGVAVDYAINSVNGSTITDNTFTIAPTYSIGTSTLNQNSFRVLTGESGFGTTDPTSTVHVNGSFATAYAAKTGAYTLTASDNIIEVTTGTHNQTLPTAVGIPGRVYTITNSGTGIVTVATTSSQTFVNVTATPTTLTLIQFETATVVSNGANWLRI